MNRQPSVSSTPTQNMIWQQHHCTESQGNLTHLSLHNIERLAYDLSFSENTIHGPHQRNLQIRFNCRTQSIRLHRTAGRIIPYLIPKSIRTITRQPHTRNIIVLLTTFPYKSVQHLTVYIYKCKRSGRQAHEWCWTA